ncbi:MAG: TonB-dependent siderophore receptor [Opitutaceae bacterium]|jgi:iron complex outermembrane receptor protein
MHKNSLLFRHFFVAALLAGLGRLPAQAGTDSEIVELPEVLVTEPTGSFATAASVGTKTSTPIAEIPQTISVITRDELDLRNAKGVAEALRYTAGVSTDAYGEDPRGYAWAKIRGFDVSFDSQYLDGLRLTNYEFPEAFGLEQIQVIKGPGSVLYGQSSPGGLISNLSKRPTATTFGDVSFELGSDQSYETTLDTGGPANAGGTVLYRLTALFRDNQEDSNGYPVNARRYYIAPALTFNLSKATTLTLLTSYFHGESTQVPGFVADPAGNPTNVYYNNKNWDLEENDIYRLGYELEHRATADLTFRQHARVSRYDVLDYYVNSLGYTAPPILDQSASIWQSSSRSFTLDNQAELKLTGEHIDQTLLAGLDYTWSSANTQYYEDPVAGLDISNPNNSAPIARPTTLYSDSYQTIAQTGLYAQDQIKLDRHWITTLSARYDWVSNDLKERTTGNSHTKQDDQALSARAGLAYVADNGLVPYVSYSTSFFPNSGADFSGAPFDPTEGEQYEIGLKYAPKNSRGTATLSLFNLTQGNVLTDDPAHIGSSVQTGEVRSRGVEFESKLALTGNLNLLLSASYADIEITQSNTGDQGNVPGLTPRALASSWLDYTFHDGVLSGLTFGGGVRYIGSSYADSTNTRKNGDYINFDLAVRYLRGDWVYSVNVTNLFDEVALTSDGYSYNESGGRTVRASIAYHW